MVRKSDIMPQNSQNGQKFFCQVFCHINAQYRAFSGILRHRVAGSISAVLPSQKALYGGVA